jgi:acetyl-CoA C-acetyltransferase
VTLPYTKLLNSNIQTDQAAALILCSDAVARELGIDRERWVYPHAAGHAHDHWFVSEREDLCSSPAIRFAARAALDAAGAGIGDVAHLDVYSCFPSAVQIACRELGIDPFVEARALTVTGGLTFAGGPGNNYVTHAIAAMVERLREDPGSLGLTTAVGWYLTKHAVGVYGTSPPRRPFTACNVQDQVDATPRRASASGVAGSAEAESVSVVYSREGEPTVGAVTALLADGRRAIAKTTDAGDLAAMGRAPITGHEIHLDGLGGVDL